MKETALLFTFLLFTFPLATLASANNRPHQRMRPRVSSAGTQEVRGLHASSNVQSDRHRRAAANRSWMHESDEDAAAIEKQGTGTAATNRQILATTARAGEQGIEKPGTVTLRVDTPDDAAALLARGTVTVQGQQFLVRKRRSPSPPAKPGKSGLLVSERKSGTLLRAATPEEANRLLDSGHVTLGSTRYTVRRPAPAPTRKTVAEAAGAVAGAAIAPSTPPAAAAQSDQQHPMLLCASSQEEALRLLSVVKTVSIGDKQFAVRLAGHSLLDVLTAKAVKSTKPTYSSAHASEDESSSSDIDDSDNKSSQKEDRVDDVIAAADQWQQQQWATLKDDETHPHRRLELQLRAEIGLPFAGCP